MSRLISNGMTGRNAGYMTFHRVDSKLIKSRSVGIPWRLVILVVGGIFLVAAGYGSIEMLQADTLVDRAVQMLSSGSDGISLQLASDLISTL